MGAVTQAMARACAGAGVTIRTDAAVARVLATGKRADGVELADVSRIGARIIVSNVHPKTLLLDMVPPDTLAAGVRARLARHANGSGTFRIHVPPPASPPFSVLPAPGTPLHHDTLHHTRHP